MAGLQGETITGVEVDGQPTSGPPIGGGDNIAAPDKVTSGLADIQREGSAAKEGLYGNIAHLANQDAFRAHKAYDAEAATAHDIPTWNEEAQKQKFSTDPVKAFGSVGSVFAMIAAAFTHRPMINALQGSAAAMDAIKAGDDQAYDKAFAAYKTNADLAIKRHQMMHEEYQDALSLMHTDMAAGEAQLKLAAMKYDDKQMLFLTENGLSDLRDKLITGRAKALESTVEANDKIDAQTLRRQTFDSMKRDVEKSGIPKDDPRYAALMAEAGRRAFAGKETPIDPQMWQWEMQHAQDHDGKGPTAEERQKFYQGFRLTGYGLSGGAGSTLTKAVGALEEDIYKDNIAAGMSETEARADAIKRAKAAAAPPITGNEREKLEAHLGQFVEADNLINRVTDVLNRYVGAAGVAGKATRMGERVSNLAGGKETDRVQLMRDISELQLMAPRLLLDATGRPLAAEAGHINDVIAGLSAGDTTANTLRAMKEIKEQLARMKQRQEQRLGEAPPPAAGSATSDASKPAPTWDDFPVKK
jgi:hypothetical protein